MNLIGVENLVKHFPLRGTRVVVRAVNGVSFGVEQGETLGLVGESGSGKTTVGRCLLKVLEPTNGQIAFRGQDITKLSQKQFRPLRSKIQIVFQEPYDSLNPRMKIGDIILEPLKLHTRLGAFKLAQKLKELIQHVGLHAELMDRYPAELSGGQQQRVGIARAIATDPEFIVLDEPISNLDPSARAEIIDLLVRLQDELGLSYLYISHDLSTVKYICDRVAVMYLGKIVEMGKKDEVFNRPIHPYSRALLSSVLYPDPRSRRSAFVLKGEIPSPINLPSGCYLSSRCPAAEPVCDEAIPPLVEVDHGHMVACFFSKLESPFASTEKTPGEGQ